MQGAVHESSVLSFVHDRPFDDHKIKVSTYQLPQSRHVGSLPDLSLIRGAVSIARNGNIHLFTRRRLVLVGKCQTRSHRDLRAFNTLTTKEIPILVVKVHAATLSFGVAINVTKQFSDNFGHATAANQGDAVTAVAGNPGVFLCKCPVNTRGNGLLPVVEMAETTNVAGLVFCVLQCQHTVLADAIKIAMKIEP